jgi:hypothetical protein
VVVACRVLWQWKEGVVVLVVRRTDGADSETWSRGAMAVDEGEVEERGQGGMLKMSRIEAQRSRRRRRVLSSMLDIAPLGELRELMMKW